MHDQKHYDAVQSRLKSRFEWKQVESPQVWRPGTDQELIGLYGGRTTKNGNYGQYEVMLVHVPRHGTFTISGTHLLQLVDSAALEQGDMVRIIYRGSQPVGEERSFKRFELFVVSEQVVETAPKKIRRRSKVH